jgi:serine/threonine protein kinase/WD40 repeat protein
MTPERWRTIREVLQEALEIAPPERPAYMDRTCAADDSLRREVESLLASSDAARSSFLESPALATVALPNGGRTEDAMGDRHLGVYQLVRRIGQGGMGAVFLAVRADGEFRQQVAIKLVPSGLDSGELLDRFRIERQTLAGLDHPNIVKLLDGGSTPEGLPYLVMDYVEGSPIDEYCDQHKLSVEQRLRLFGKVCEAVEYAHQKQVIHRDLKPSNILVTASGVPKLLDFGIAKVLEPTAATLSVTQTSTRCMTPAYASPEQVRGGRVTPATDVYSLGIVLYELLSGRGAYRLKGHAPSEIERAICEQTPEAPSTAVGRVETETSSDGTTVTKTPELVSQAREGQPEKLRRRLRGDLDNIVLKALRKEPARRYESVQELARDIDRHLNHLPITARPPSLAYRASKFIQRHKVEASGALAAVIVLLLIAAGWFFRTDDSAHPSLHVTPLTTYLGAEVFPTFSPDGRRIAFVWNGEDEKQVDLFVKPIGPGDPVRLTRDPEPECYPAWSPDGRFIAFLHCAPGTIDGFIPGTAEVWLVSATGGAKRRVGVIDSPDYFPIPPLAWMSDSKALIVRDKVPNSSQFALFLLALESGEKHQLTWPPANWEGDSAPAVSPDGRSLAFIRTAHYGASYIFLKDLTIKFKTQAKQLTWKPAFLLNVMWRATGRRSSPEILYLVNDIAIRSLWRVASSGDGPPKQVSAIGELGMHVAISPQGDRLAYTNHRWIESIWRLDLSGSRRKPATPFRLISSTRPDLNPQISPDGKRIAFSSGRTGSMEIWLANGDGSGVRQLTSFGAETGTPRWSPDSTRIAADSNVGGTTHIYIIDTRDGTSRELTTGAGDDRIPSWSSDGKWIYFASNRTGEYETWKVAVDGGSAVRISRGGGYGGFESPDGRFFYYVKGSEPPYSVWRMPSRGGEERQIIPRIRGWYAFSVADDGIYYIPESASQKQFWIRFRSFSTDREQTIAEVAQQPGMGFAMSPDRHWFLFAPSESRNGDLMLVDNFR